MIKIIAYYIDTTGTGFKTSNMEKLVFDDQTRSLSAVSLSGSCSIPRFYHSHGALCSVSG